MSELNEQRWAVISERGREAHGLRHEAAHALVRRLAGEKLSGLCVVADEAATRIQRAAQQSSNGKPTAINNTPRKKRAAKK